MGTFKSPSGFAGALAEMQSRAFVDCGHAVPCMDSCVASVRASRPRSKHDVCTTSGTGRRGVTEGLWEGPSIGSVEAQLCSAVKEQ